MIVFGHHTHGFLEVEIMGHPFPDGPTEHALAAGLLGVALALMCYGVYAGVRDFWRWRQRRLAARRV
jgi:hypothetical protein